MNQSRRKEIRQIIDELETLRSRLEDVTEAEQEAFDNMPESFQSGEKGQKIESYISTMGDASDQISDASNTLEEIFED